MYHFEQFHAVAFERMGRREIMIRLLDDLVVDVCIGLQAVTTLLEEMIEFCQADIVFAVNQSQKRGTSGKSAKRRIN